MAASRYRAIEARAGLIGGLAPLGVPAHLAELRGAEWLWDLGVPKHVAGIELAMVASGTTWALIALGALLVRRGRATGTTLLVAGTLIFALTGAAASALDPFGAFLFLTVAIAGPAWLLFERSTYQAVRGDRFNRELVRTREWSRGSTMAAMGGLALGLFSEPATEWVAVACSAVPLAFLIFSRKLPLEAWRIDRRVATTIVSTITALGIFLYARPELAASFFAVAAGVTFLALPGRRLDLGTVEESWTDTLMDEPLRLLLVTFAVTAIFGGILLTLPISASDPSQRILLVDATFTSFSAVCVTGLTVRDTGGDFSVIGQAIIIALVQIGGLGIMTFQIAATTLMGQRLSMKAEGAAAALMGAEDRGALTRALGRMLRVTFASEAIGAVIMATRFVMRGEELVPSLWKGVFTAISAYCNSGFALQSDSVMSYQDDPIILHTVATLVIIGGLGPPIIAAILAFGAKRFEPYVKLALLTTGVLLVVPMVLVCLLEWSGSLSGLSVAAKLNNAWFHTVVSRTAGFNSIDVASLHPATITLTEVLMFIGGCPGSTAGGAKTTTVAIVILALARTVRQRERIIIFGRRVGRDTSRRAFAVVSVLTLFIVVGIFLLQATQSIASDKVIFEAISALATVGLSLGASAELDEVGKILVMGMMFIGRVGALGLLMAVAAGSEDDTWDRPELEIPVG